MTPWLAWVVVTLIGGLVGLGELVSRYRDAPFRAATSPPGVVYIVLNAVAGVAALALSRQLGWVMATDRGDIPLGWVLAAGFGAVAVLRSSVFAVRAGNQDVSVGPSALLQIVLQAADREVDRTRATQRALAVDRAMEGVSFEKAQAALPAYCLVLMQNVPQDEQERLAREVAALADSEMPEAAKARALGLALMNVVGEGVLQAAVRSLGEQIR
ncbi:MAG: hypothetical protein HYY00_02050 [Chloroflexi bacterium]|nr:hypothetical protein [Chloroflexota bacterium]